VAIPRDLFGQILTRIRQLSPVWFAVVSYRACLVMAS
jgi:hypothetical protein